MRWNPRYQDEYKVYDAARNVAEQGAQFASTDRDFQTLRDHFAGMFRMGSPTFLGEEKSPDTDVYKRAGSSAGRVVVVASASGSQMPLRAAAFVNVWNAFTGYLLGLAQLYTGDAYANPIPADITRAVQDAVQQMKTYGSTGAKGSATIGIPVAGPAYWDDYVATLDKLQEDLLGSNRSYFRRLLPLVSFQGQTPREFAQDFLSVQPSVVAARVRADYERLDAERKTKQTQARTRRESQTRKRTAEQQERLSLLSGMFGAQTPSASEDDLFGAPATTHDTGTSLFAAPATPTAEGDAGVTADSFLDFLSNPRWSSYGRSTRKRRFSQ